MKSVKERIKAYSAISSGSFLILLSLLVLFGWYTKNETIIRVSSSYSAMVFNTALSILGIGIGLLFLPSRWRVITRIVSLLVLILTFLSLAQYLFKVNFHIDELFHKYDLTTPMLFPGRMSLNTAICLFVGTVTLFLLTYKKYEINFLFSLILSCVALSIPVASIFGYFAGIESIVEWAGFSRMSLNTAISCIFMGITILIWSAIESYRSYYKIYAFPIAISFSVVVGTIAVWGAFYSRDFLSSIQNAENKAKELQFVINVLLKEDVTALARMAERWEVLGGYSKELWEVDSSNYIHDLPALKSIQIVNKELKVLDQTSLIKKKSLGVIKKYEKQLEDLNKGKNAYYYDKNQGLLNVLIPIKKNSEFEQFLYASIDISVVFQKALESLKISFYKVLFLKDKRIIFYGEEVQSPSIGPPVEKIIAENFVPFSLQLFVTKKSLKEELSGLGLFIIITGVTITLLSSLLVYFFLDTKNKNILLEILNRDLKFSKEKSDQATLAKSAFLATMSHEIRTPLNSVIGTVQILAETEINDVQRKYINRIEFSSRALLNLINDILDYSKLEAGRLNFENAPFDLIELVKSIYEDFLIKSDEKKVSFFIELPTQPMPQIIGDAHRIEQILINLINNAFKFTEQGEITIKIEYKPKEQNNAYVYFEVVDTGIGISPENQQKLFQKFSQVEVSNARKYGGVGLGLSICKSLIEKMQGQIGVKSAEGRGTTFWFEIPFLVQTSEKLELYSLENAQILLLDSNKRESEIIYNYLKAWKANVQTSYADELSDIQLVIISSDQKELIQKLEEKKVPILYIEKKISNQVGEEVIFQPITPGSLWNAIQKKLGK